LVLLSAFKIVACGDARPANTVRRGDCASMELGVSNRAYRIGAEPIVLTSIAHTCEIPLANADDPEGCSA